MDASRDSQDSKMADSSPANSIIEGTVKFRDGKKVRISILSISIT